MRDVVEMLHELNDPFNALKEFGDSGVWDEASACFQAKNFNHEFWDEMLADKYDKYQEDSDDADRED
jgi:hypothetical protein